MNVDDIFPLSLTFWNRDFKKVHGRQNDFEGTSHKSTKADRGIRDADATDSVTGNDVKKIK